mgnify:FL=1|tara:strand:+ start:438 stop:659 length:222 start_codon:yes stop_codon:yes gene_type:complete
MAKDEKKTITVNDITRNVEDLNEQEVVMVNHIHDLDRKLANARFNVDQLTVGRDAFVNMLTSVFENPIEQPTE